MFNKSLFKKELRESRWKIIVGLIILIITAVSIPLTFTYVKELVDLFPQIPGLEGFDRFLENYSIYTWSQWNGKNLYQIGTILGIIMGMNLIAGEKVSKTLEFLLAKPMSRASLYLTKFATAAISLGIIVLGSTALLYIVSLIMGYQILPGELFISTIVTLIGFIFVLTLTMLISTVLDEPVKVGLLSAFILFLLAVPGWFQKTYFLSVFHHMTASEYMLEGSFPFTSLIIILLLIGGMYYMGFKLFEKKEP
ncbi:ABC transporter permease [Candidatus Contubernalis alkaliaceticus]|uniref:ABC transporter permease n=1 Tax=Candidatus Contubernalis alkaliaceticus TaxID=338645 RepID=UPI001F4BE4FE|nr:ABC transporter permease subunit [Candidatus Contubernalis alkalaceticus]UNC91971.1 ABC transporter permease subunit [Candidatus Contubernalis alkalaceticus]